LITYGYTSNVGIAYTMTEQDFQQWWYIQERQSLIRPDSPVGAGLVISTSKSSDPKHLRFTCGDSLTLEEPHLLAQSFRNINDVGLSLPFAANASSLQGCSSSTPLIVLNLADFGPSEIEQLKFLQERGTRLAAFASKSSLSKNALELFSREGTILFEKSASSLTRAEALTAAERIHDVLQIAIRFPEGTTGYGFRSQDTIFVVVEDWLELARQVDLRLSKSEGAKTATACNVNDHSPFNVRDSGKDWIVEIPLSSGDGVLVALKESLRGS
jgi:hypothetical protein